VKLFEGLVAQIVDQSNNFSKTDKVSELAMKFRHSEAG
jgi:hypothetical protein